jgi:hypothetical protein
LGLVNITNLRESGGPCLSQNSIQIPACVRPDLGEAVDE